MLSLHIFLEFEDMFQLSKISGSSFGYDIFVEIFKTDVKIQGFFFFFFSFCQVRGLPRDFCKWA